MTPYKKRLTPLVKRMAEDMLVRNFSPGTIDSYTYQVDRFQKHFEKPIEEVGEEEIRQYQLHLVQVKQASWSSFNQAVCGLRFLYEVTLRKPWTVKHIPFGKRPKRLPTVLADEEVQRLLEWVSYPKHRMVLLMCYAAGLRLSEATHVRLGDIDGVRGMLHIRSGKGRKDRYVPLAPRLLKELREYWKLDQPTDYLFAGRTANVSLSTATVQKACKMAAAQARINKSQISPHTLRHSYATAMLEAGVDILTISRLLGHSSFVTTMVYLHCRRLHLDRAPSPIDWLPVRQCPKWIDPCDPNPFHPSREHPSVDPTQLDPIVPPAPTNRPAADRRQPDPE
jgi:integrase/recombinase XerD